MPAVSQKQQRLMAMAEHHPSKIKKKNRGVLTMSHQQLHDFAATTRKGLPRKVKGRSRGKSEYAKGHPSAWQG